jgi:hypothetical protein
LARTDRENYDSPDGNAEFSAVLKGVRAFGLRSHAALTLDREIILIEQGED